MKTLPELFHLAYLLIGGLVLVSCKEEASDQKAKLRSIKMEMEQVLTSKMLDVWYSRAIDSVDGGYLSVFDDHWNLVGDQDKFIVAQARHLWTLSVAAERFPQNPFYPGWAQQGFEFIKSEMWDHTYGGFYDLRTKTGESPGEDDPEVSDESDDKRAYGNAFGIYGLSTYARVAKNKEALELAKEAFRWMEAHSYDQQYGGYNQFLTREGTPYHLAPEKKDIPYWQSFKDQNSSIHILEAYTSLYQVWPNDTLKNKLHELFLLIRDKITNEEGYMTLFFYPDWQRVSFRDSLEKEYRFDHVSFGHDIETAYLLLEAQEVLGLHDTLTYFKTRRMVDHSLKGIDNQAGGLIYEGYYVGDKIEVIDDKKSWWVQAEGLNSLLLFSGLYPGDQTYLHQFISLWDYCSDYMIDWQYGGWYSTGIDNYPGSKTGNKGDLWKTPYHTTRSMTNCIDMLEER